MKDKINIQIDLERIDSSVGRINDLIRNFVMDLKKEKGIEVLKYNLIKTMLVNPNEKEIKKN